MPKTLELDLLEGRLYLVMIPLPFSNSQLTTEVLFHEPLQLIIPEDHQLAKLKKIQPHHLSGQNILTLEEQYSSYHQIDFLCTELGVNIARDYQGISLDALRQMVQTWCKSVSLIRAFCHRVHGSKTSRPNSSSTLWCEYQLP